MFSVYLLELVDGSIYTGQTHDLEKRLQQHQSGVGSKYIRSRLPCKLQYTEYYDTRSEAMKREYQIKQFSKIEKLALISRKF